MQVRQWAASYPDMVFAAVPIATGAHHTAQNIAFHEVGRQAIHADPEWRKGRYWETGTVPTRANFMSALATDSDADGGWVGFDVDFCRAVAATIFGDGNKIRVYPVETERDFLQNDDIDVAFHGPSWNFSRELSSGLAFGPVIFHDGQAFLARRASGFQSLEAAGKPSICVQGNTRFASNLLAYVRDTGAEASVREMPGRLSARAAFLGGQCDLLTDDASALVTMTAGQGDAFEILPDRISKEPMAPAVRRADESLLAIVRWTIYAVIEAEEIGITAATINEPVPGRRAIADLFDLPAASALGLSNDWAYRTIKAVGNYGEIYDRNLAGPAMPRMQRGLNENWTRGGLMYAPPLR